MEIAKIIDQYDDESPVATELRRLFNVLRVKSQPSGVKSLMITSSSRGEGKSTIAALLSITIARSGRRRVLIIDADMRRPKVHELFELPNKRGLKACLKDAENPLDVLQHTSLPNLDVISSGGRSVNPSALFEAEALEDFFAKVKFYYDIIIVDSPPILPVSDTLFLCPQVESVLMVILAGETPRQAAMRAKELLMNANANVAGIVVNNATDTLPIYYSYRYYGYADDR